MRLLACLAAACGLLLAAALPARAATVSSDGATLRVAAAPGEVNTVTITRDTPFGAAPTLTVRDEGTPPVAAGPCTPTLDPSAVTCRAGAVARADVALGDGDDELAGGAGGDVIDGGTGDDDADGGAGDDRIVMRDRKSDTAVCGPGRDRVRAEVLDQLDLTCEVVDYGPAGQRGRLAVRTGGGRFVRVPGQGTTRVDRRILPDVLYLVRRYHLRLGDGFAVNGNHERLGEHPLGLGLDIYPGPGGSWNQIDRLAKWAEPRQNHPRPPFRWVGYNGDYNHGRGNHLHLSWMHSAGRPGRPVRSVWAWAVHGAAAADR